MFGSGKEQLETDHNKTLSERIHNMAAKFQREGRSLAAGGPRELHSLSPWSSSPLYVPSLDLYLAQHGSSKYLHAGRKKTAKPKEDTNPPAFDKIHS